MPFWNVTFYYLFIAKKINIFTLTSYDGRALTQSSVVRTVHRNTYNICRGSQTRKTLCFKDITFDWYKEIMHTIFFLSCIHSCTIGELVRCENLWKLIDQYAFIHYLSFWSRSLYHCHSTNVGIYECAMKLITLKKHWFALQLSSHQAILKLSFKQHGCRWNGDSSWKWVTTKNRQSQ